MDLKGLRTGYGQRCCLKHPCNEPSAEMTYFPTIGNQELTVGSGLSIDDPFSE